ncbi:hypothetical protein TCAL_05431 [Tigriopus californicus]|uniref:Uncharacterized protein n=1 Tax=Tigriopus californicus TaxID=6832 RepID=A0A553NZ12_TIGCA|nr:GON-4-like protein [Tigriopus californicus]TRY70679.1 hypothetical protein TCAL_05431 [Tigriopus californicus]
MTIKDFEYREVIIFLLLTISLDLSQAETTVEPGSACRYKVWFLEACIEAEHSQTVHLILSKGGVQCDITKHLTKVCIPSQDNKHPITPSKALFKDLLEGNQPVSKEGLQETIENMDPEDLPEVLKLEESPAREKAEATILDEIKEYNQSTVVTTTEPEGAEFEEDLKKLLGIEAQNNQTNFTEQDTTGGVGVSGITVSNMMTELLKELNDVGSLKNQSSNTQNYPTTSSSANATESENGSEAQFVDKLMGIFQVSNSTRLSDEQNTAEEVMTVTTTTTTTTTISDEKALETRSFASAPTEIISTTLMDATEDLTKIVGEKLNRTREGQNDSFLEEERRDSTKTPDHSLVRSATGTQTKNFDFAKKALSLSITAKPKFEQKEELTPNRTLEIDVNANHTKGNSSKPWDILNRLKNRRQELRDLGRNQKMRTVLEEMGLGDSNQTDISADSLAKDNSRVIVADTNEATNIKGFFQDLPSPGNGSRVINWMIQNMPNGKQTIVIL